MHIRSILAIARKDAIDIIVNKSTLFMLMTPIFLALLFLVIGLLLDSHITNVLVYNPGKSGVQQVADSAFSSVKVTYANSPQDVAAAFGPNGSQKNSTYALGLAVPLNFDASLQAGQHPQLQLYIDGSQLDNQQSALLVRAITDYTRSVANPQSPVSMSVATINPPSPSQGFQSILQYYAVGALLSSFMVGVSLVPNLLVEEKEKKTLRMLMVSPASFGDVVLAKMLIGLVYQLILGLLAVAITGGFNGTQVPLVLLFALLGSCLSIAVGLLIGGIAKTTSATGAFAGGLSFFFILPFFAVGPLALLLGSNPFTQIIRILPTYYIADGASNAVLNTSTFGSVLLDAVVLVAVTLVLVLIATWTLRRQATVVSAI